MKFGDARLGSHLAGKAEQLVEADFYEVQKFLL
jgi:hypothetical protein